MPSTTGIELGPDSCVLVAAGPATDGVVDVAAVHTITPSEWPAQGASLADTLRAVRRRQGFPRNARVVVWGLPDTEVVDPAIARGAVGQVTAAGFRVDAVLTPPQGLALLASSRPRSSADTAVAWLALNTHGAAIAIVRGSELLFARTFRWSYDARPMTPKAQLLQRYSLVAHLAPEVRRGLAAVRASTGAIVEAAVTCGDLPELRSLTMPLIEELDLEVETLDSVDGLRAVRKATGERLAEAAPAIRLSCAVASSAPAVATTSGSSSLTRLAAAAAVILAVAGAGYVYSQRAGVRPQNPEPDRQGEPAAAAAAPPPRIAPPAAATPGHEAPATAPVTGLPAPSETPAQQQPAHLKADSKKAPVLTAATPALVRTPAVRPDGPVTPAAAPTTGSKAPAPQSSTTTRPAPVPRDPGTAIDPMWLPPTGTSTQSPAAPQGPPTDGLPRIDSILIDQSRRLAVIDGKTVGIGDAVGSRVVVQIDPDSVVLRESSGLSVRLQLRPKAPVDKF